jgi:hypothetical protein
VRCRAPRAVEAAVGDSRAPQAAEAPAVRRRAPRVTEAAVVDRWVPQAVGATVVVMRVPRAAEAAVGDRWQVGSSGGGGDCGGASGSFVGSAWRVTVLGRH